MSFQQGLSGLNVTAKALDTIGNNIANSGTVGFKAATTQFADVFAASLNGGGTSQIGIGASLSRVAQQFTQGNITNTNNPLDMSINGAGMYRMSDSGTISYTRAGQFQLDKDGFITSAAGLKLTGYAADPATGTISPGNLIPLQVLNTNIAPKTTTASQIQVNLDSRALPPSSMSSGSLTGATALDALTPIDSTNNVLNLVVDGNPVSVTIPVSATGYTAASMATTLESLINSALSSTGTTVTVNNSASGKLTITSDSKGSLGSAGNGSSVSMDTDTLGGPAASVLFGAPATQAGSATAGYVTGGADVTVADVVFSVPQNFDLTVDGTLATITVPAGTYTTADGSVGSLQATLQGLVDAAFAPAGTVSVAAISGSPVTITSGTLGASSSVALSAMDAEFTTLMGGPVSTAGTASNGSLAGGLDLPSSVTIGSGESFSLTVDGVTKTVSIPSGTYSTAGVAPTELQTALQDAIDLQFLPAGTVTVVAGVGAPLTITSGSSGATSEVMVESMTSGIESLFGPTTVAGSDNFNQITAQTSGTLSSETALTATLTSPIVIAAATNDVLNINVDGNAVSVTLSPATYNTLADLAADVQTQINDQLAADGFTARVSATINASNKLIITSDSSGTDSSVTLTGGGGTAATGLFGASPVVVAGNQTQTIDTLGFTASTAQTVYDSLGNPHNLSLYFVKTSSGNVWQMYTTLDNGQQTGPEDLSFNGSGLLTTPMPITLPATGSFYSFTSSSTNAATPDPMQFTLDLRGSTQYGISFGVNTLNQDGYSSGQLSGIAVGSDGVIQGRYSNGKSQNMGQIVLVNFNNPNGLRSLGGNQWAETTESGQAIPGSPGSGSLGVIQSAAIEESNVDLTKELVDMITQQRVYQANAQTIKTQDSVLQTLVNLR